jgi:hypothetical protein
MMWWCVVVVVERGGRVIERRTVTMRKEEVKKADVVAELVVRVAEETCRMIQKGLWFLRLGLCQHIFGSI